MTWPLSSFKCSVCCRNSDYGIFGPAGWVCYNCDVKGIYDRQSYLRISETTLERPNLSTRWLRRFSNWAMRVLERFGV